MRLLAIPAVLYGLWYLSYDVANFRRDNLLVSAQYFVDAIGGGVGALLGLSAGYHAVLALALVVLIGWGWMRPGPPRPRLLTVVTLPVAFGLLTGIGRAQDMQPTTSRYLLPSAIFGALVACEALRGTRFPPRAAPLALALVAFASWTHVSALRTEATGIATSSQASSARSSRRCRWRARPGRSRSTSSPTPSAHRTSLPGCTLRRWTSSRAGARSGGHVEDLVQRSARAR